MSPATAQRAAEFFLEHNCEADVSYVTFYGGEPTLNMDAISTAVDTVESHNKKTCFGLTTNGYALTDHILDYFVKHKFFIIVSVDGPELVHNTFRKNLAGEGTFASVYRMLERFRHLDEAFFLTNVTISAVNTSPAHLRAMREFFDDDPVVKEVRVRVSGVSDSSTTFFEGRDRAEGLTEYELLRDEYKQHLIDCKPYCSKFLAALFEGEFLKLHKRKIFGG